ncbi:MAG: bifunctional glutamate N-acetyltransferase/amino-acid acetyltransferase ArgJ [Peptococcaceae bacterium]|nr:bifunctional glutamate N-acetyltransferase/amino-acid acetyltransferase ArgJ [Peptococcaceae bacterium]
MPGQGLGLVDGFEYAGIRVGGKKNNIGLVFSTVENTVGAAVYTKSDIVAAPVILSKEMDAHSPRKRAVMINSGTANAFTGRQGVADAREMIKKLAETLAIEEHECYVGSTGVIGEKLEIDHIVGGIEELVRSKNRENSADFIEAIMTTDTKMKQSSVSLELDHKEVHMAACAKGSGMIMPDMATMLCVVTTDVSIQPDLLQEALRQCVKTTMNCVTVDGDTSTNDTVFILANGVAGNRTICQQDENYDRFVEKLTELLEEMAKQIVHDGEGITKFITLRIRQTPSEETAKKIAFSIANSPLVKTAMFGESLNWGRLMMAIGKAQTGIDCSRIDIIINGVQILRDSELLGSEAYDAAQNSLKGYENTIEIDFKAGDQEYRVWTCDFSYDYVKINADYLT